jgi:hypothetical protein
MTFEDLRKIIAEKNKELVTDPSFTIQNYFWKDRKMVSLDQWFQTKENYTLKAAMQISQRFPKFWIPYILDNVERRSNTKTSKLINGVVLLPVLIIKYWWVFQITSL